MLQLVHPSPLLKPAAISSSLPTTSELYIAANATSKLIYGRLSREQREEMYRAARERIFGSSEDSPAGSSSTIPI